MTRGLLLLFTLLLTDEPKVLPCADSSPACVATLQQTAIANHREIRILDQAIDFQRRKLWTSWLNADGIHPAAIALRIAQNIAGGGDHAAAKLEIARLKARRAELESNLRTSVLRKAIDLDSARNEAEMAATRCATLDQRIRIFIVSYRLGGETTAAMLQLWESAAEAARQADRAQGVVVERLTELRALVGWEDMSHEGARRKHEEARRKAIEGIRNS